MTWRQQWRHLLS